MENWIEHVHEPDKLYLAWQAPDHMKDRHRWAVGEVLRSAGGATLRYIKDRDEFSRLNGTRTYRELKDLGFTGYPGYPWTQPAHRTGVIEAFMRRLPPRERSDFGTYLRYLRIHAEASISDFALLGYSEGKLPSDGFSFVDPLERVSPPIELMQEVAGYRYYADAVGKLEAGTRLEIVRESDNTFDPDAVMFSVEGRKVGNVNRLQTKAFGMWTDTRSLSAVVERVVGTAEKPILHTFVWVE